MALLITQLLEIHESQIFHQNDNLKFSHHFTENTLKKVKFTELVHCFLIYLRTLYHQVDP